MVCGCGAVDDEEKYIVVLIIFFIVSVGCVSGFLCKFARYLAKLMFVYEERFSCWSCGGECSCGMQGRKDGECV